MDNNVQPSFIPKKPLSQQSQSPRSHVSLISLISTIVFITVLLLAGIVYGAEFVVSKNIEEKKETLQAELNKFQGALVNELSRLDGRFGTAQSLLDKHLSVAQIFDVLGDATLKNVRFTGFTFSNENQHPVIALDGQTANFTNVALQQQELTDTKKIASSYFKDVVVTNPNLDSKGNVAFTFSASLDLQKFAYANVIKSQGVTVASTTVRASVSPTGSTTNATSSRVRR